MGEIAVEHGFYSDDCGEPENPAFEASAECWVIADATKFMDLFEKTREVVGSDVDTAALQLNIYTSVVYAFLVIAGIFVIVAFFGCCGAWKENKCMLGTYFLLITILLIGLLLLKYLVLLT